jgi:hypothetical protein
VRLDDEAGHGEKEGNRRRRGEHSRRAVEIFLGAFDREKLLETTWFARLGPTAETAFFTFTGRRSAGDSLRGEGCICMQDLECFSLSFCCVAGDMPCL